MVSKKETSKDCLMSILGENIKEKDPTGEQFIGLDGTHPDRTRMWPVSPPYIGLEH